MSYGIRLAVAAIGLALATPTIAGAQSYQQRQDNVQANQADRINSGVKSGDLTRAEAKKLRIQQRQAKRYERRAEADGSVTAQEKRVMNKQAQQNSRRINREAVDNQAR